MIWDIRAYEHDCTYVCAYELYAIYICMYVICGLILAQVAILYKS